MLYTYVYCEYNKTNLRGGGCHMAGGDMQCETHDKLTFEWLVDNEL